MPTWDGVSELARAYLDDARRATPGLGQRPDPDSLHDFRVALRRLRGLLRAYRAPLGPRISKRLRRRLSAVADSTGAGRDADVMLLWITGQMKGLSRSERVGARWLADRIRTRRDSDPNARRIPNRFDRLDRRLRKRLAAEAHTPGLPSGPSFAGTTARLVTDAAVALTEALRRIRKPEDTEAAHDARLTGKRLRYLLEPVADAAAGAPALIDRLRTLQELLGEFNECQVMLDEIAEGVEALGAARAREAHDLQVDGKARPRLKRGREDAGLLALARRARARRDDLYFVLESQWLGEHAAEVIPLVREGVATLTTRRSAPYPFAPRVRRYRTRHPVPPQGA
ncbi:MAG TPA: CHAD domain-containing protein [Gemmatimonadales bacterium]|jgi:CHAD domain-containing protein|nr:CHAD domain-containing protein [Gemmatimonadales bacterium]